ncbi:hypothetical protein [Hymenobacter sp. BT559]|jgi:hypothetical protein|uniref:hypothetical protein n=1 Tax=Hymenobacter sp. BT559 TaxID=2795729 RepID=UPI0018EE0A89|nr:hypothetical protein [Hymenobacter sp. BT559]MBJ6142644.1 hypothetical protein [Hymenobacter sp. BT559]
MKRFSFPAKLPGQVAGAARQAGRHASQTGRLFRQLVQRALDAVQEVLHAEVQNGHARLVIDFLADKALPAARALLLERMTARLLLRLGLRGAFLTNVAGWVLPFVLEKMFQVARSSGLLAKLEANPTVANTLAWVDELRHAAARLIFPDGDTGAVVLTEEEAQELLAKPTAPEQA